MANSCRFSPNDLDVRILLWYEFTCMVLPRNCCSFSLTILIICGLSTCLEFLESITEPLKNC